MKRILITGGNGFIGRNLTEYLQARYEVIAPSRREVNLLDEGAVQDYVSKGHFDVVLHTATENATVNGKSRNEVLNHNLQMYLYLERCTEHYGEMISLGSGAEYDRLHYQPLMSEDFFGTHVPVDDYGLSKFIISERIEKQKNIRNLRLFGVYGAYEDWEIRFISNVVCRVMYGLPIFIKQNVVFDYLYVMDLARIIEWFIEHPTQEKIFNVCTSQTSDLISLANFVLEVSGGINIPIHVVKEGLGREYSGNNARLLSAMGGFSFTDFASGVSELYRWYAQNKAGINRERLFYLK